MNKLFAVALALVSLAASAMPTKAELEKAQPLVAELMQPCLKQLREKTISPEEAGDKAVAFADKAASDAQKYLFLKSAVQHYTRAKEYDLVVDTIRKMERQIKDVPPETLQQLVSSAAKEAKAANAPRLFRLQKRLSGLMKFSAARREVVRELKKNPNDATLMRRYAELTAALGDWDKALRAFVKAGGEVGKVAQQEMDCNALARQNEDALRQLHILTEAGKRDSEDFAKWSKQLLDLHDKLLDSPMPKLAAYWWDYKPVESGVDKVFRLHAATCYGGVRWAENASALDQKLAEQRMEQANREWKEEPIKPYRDSKGRTILRYEERGCSVVQIEYTESTTPPSNDGNTGIDLGACADPDIVCVLDVTFLVNSGATHFGNFGNPEMRLFQLKDTETVYDCPKEGFRLRGDIGIRTGTRAKIEIGNCYIKNLTTGQKLVGKKQAFSGEPITVKAELAEGFFEERALNELLAGSGARWYAIKIYKGGKLVRDFVPARFLDPPFVGLWDKVEHVFHERGHLFTSGPDVISAKRK